MKNKKAIFFASLVLVAVVLFSGSALYYRIENEKSAKADLKMAQETFEENQKIYDEKRKIATEYTQVIENSQALENSKTDIQNEINEKVTRIQKANREYGDLTPKLSAKILELPAPAGKNLRNYGLKFYLEIQEQQIQEQTDSDHFNEARIYARKLQPSLGDLGIIYHLYSTLEDMGRPFRDDDWPLSVYRENADATYYIGEAAYDALYETNFSLENPNGKYAAAQDIKAIIAYIQNN